MRTVLALFAVAAMVAGAFVVRGALGSGPSPAAPTTSEPQDPGTPLTLICIEELEAVCEAIAAEADLDLTVEPAGETADRLAAATSPGDSVPDGWLTLDPWPGMVSGTRDRAGRPPILDQDVEALGRSPLVVVAFEERAVVLAETCAEPIGWACIGSQAGTPWGQLGGEETWGRLRPAIADPAQSAVGLLVLGQATADFFSAADLSAAELDQQVYRAWLDRLYGARPDLGGSPLDRMVLQGASAGDAVGVTRVEADSALDRARAGGLALFEQTPVRTADVVVAATAGERGDALSATLAEHAPQALAAAGWQPAGDPALPQENGLPPAGLMEALRLRWQDLR